MIEKGGILHLVVGLATTIPPNISCGEGCWSYPASTAAEKYLGRRVLAQKEYALRQRQEAGRQAARDRKRGMQDADTEA